jgi:uracil phosphoribosyltransferase
MNDLVHLGNHPLVRQKLTALRNRDTDTPTFRRLLHELATLLLIDAIADLQLEPMPVCTPIAETIGVRLAERVAFVPVLRAGLGMLGGALELIPEAPVWHLGIRRAKGTLRPVTYYSPPQGLRAVDRCFVLDPTVATGGTAAAAVDAVRQWTGDARISYVTTVASPQGLHHMRQAHPDVPVYLAAIDHGLNEAGYITPGLGDVGDRLFGTP